MRLLFIYFYNTKGTFKKDTIISLSKKYCVTHNGNFNFTLTKNNLFQDNFYGESIDIGAIIGENGTGKSVLINSLRDGDNDYSLAVYQKGDGEFFYEKSFDKEVFIIDSEVSPFDDIFSIYYSPIIDYINICDDADFNISDKYLLNEFEKLSNGLSKIEEQDINENYNRR